jgi:hypothetical protein
LQVGGNENAAVWFSGASLWSYTLMRVLLFS